MMVSDDLASDFASADAEGHRTIHQFQREREQVLYTLAAGKNEVGIEFMTPAQLSDVLRDCYHISVPRQRITALLSKEKGSVAKRRIAGKQHYKIMKKGEDEIRSSGITSVFIEPEAALSQIRRVEETLAGLRGSLKVCDPYVDNHTLDMLAECRAAEHISLLTVNLNKEARFRRDMASFVKEHGNILDVRVLENGKLHDRYIIHADGMLLLGTSLNGLGKKQSFVVSLGEDLRHAVSPAFNRCWASAKKLS